MYVGKGFKILKVCGLKDETGEVEEQEGKLLESVCV